jgi:hypothetical protein
MGIGGLANRPQQHQLARHQVAPFGLAHQRADDRLDVLRADGFQERPTDRRRAAGKGVARATLIAGEKLALGVAAVRAVW